MSRPPKAAADKHDNGVLVRFNERDWKKISRAAEKAGIPTAIWARVTLLAKVND